MLADDVAAGSVDIATVGNECHGIAGDVAALDLVAFPGLVVACAATANQSTAPAVAGCDFFVDDFAMGHVYALGAVEADAVVAAIEFGRVDGEFACGCADTECAIPRGLHPFVFTVVAVVVVAAALVIHFDVVGVFGTEVDFVTANDGAAALVAQVELGRLKVGFFGTTEDDGAAGGVAFELSAVFDLVRAVVAAVCRAVGAAVYVRGLWLEVEGFARGGAEVFASVNGAAFAVEGVAGVNVAVVAGQCAAVADVLVLQAEAVTAANAAVVAEFAAAIEVYAVRTNGRAAGVQFVRLDAGVELRHLAGDLASVRQGEGAIYHQDHVLVEMLGLLGGE